MVRINVNAGWMFDRVLIAATYGVGVDWRRPIMLDADRAFGRLAMSRKRTGHAAALTGLRWRPVDWNVDLIYGRNITGENANFTVATVALSAQSG
jgi:hypothetical protein